MTKFSLFLQYFSSNLKKIILFHFYQKFFDFYTNFVTLPHCAPQKSCTRSGQYLPLHIFFLLKVPLMPLSDSEGNGNIFKLPKRQPKIFKPCRDTKILLARTPQRSCKKKFYAILSINVQTNHREVSRKQTNMHDRLGCVLCGDGAER